MAISKDSKILITINRLKGILNWSDRIGSDERAEIEDIIKFLKRGFKHINNL